MTAIRVLLVDDHTLVRAGLRSLLGGMPGVEVIGEADNGEAALALVRNDAPDILVTDIEMKGLDGLELAARLKGDFPAVRVAILSMHSSEEYVQQALRAGAAAYLLKDAAPLELESALRALMRGETYLSPRVTTQVVSGYVQAGTPAAEVLTARQKEILKRIAEGQSAKEIAFELEVSVKTVEAHRAQIMDRLKIGDIAGLVKYAIRSGLTKLE